MLKGLGPLMTYVQCIQPTQQEAEEEAKIIRASLPSKNGIQKNKSVKIVFRALHDVLTDYFSNFDFLEI